MHVRIEEDDGAAEVQMAPLIDCVFLLLIFFMVAGQLKREESQLGMTLPGSIRTSEPVQMLDEQVVQISASGRVWLNGLEFDNAASTELPQLTGMLARYRDSSRMARQTPFITLDSDDRAPHQRMVDVLNACQRAGIKHVTVTTD